LSFLKLNMATMVLPGHYSIRYPITQAPLLKAYLTHG
jgi:hypothetical protein